MPFNPFDYNFASLSHSVFILMATGFADCLLTHSFFKDNWPDYLPHPLVLKEQLNTYHLAVAAVEADGGKKNLKARDDARDLTYQSVVLMGQYVVMRSISENNPDLLNVGLKLKVKTVRNGKPKALTAPIVTVKHGSDSGSVLVNYSQVVVRGSYEVQYCLGDPNDEASWKPTAGQYTKCHANVQGLEPARKVYFRVRCHVDGVAGPFSQTVNIIVL